MNPPGLPGTASQQAFATALLDPAQACPPGLRTWNGSEPSRRLAVYRNNVVSSLIDALADTFPVVEQLVGTDFFRAMAGVFVRAHPPRTRILAHYGEDFASFVAAFPPTATLPYLPDMARLEFARLQAMHAADASPIAQAALATALSDPERLADLRFQWHPSLRLIESPFAVASLWAAHQTQGEVGPVNIDQAEQALVLRDGLDVLVIPIDPGTGRFIDLTLQGRSFSHAAAAATSHHARFELGSALSMLLRHQALVALREPLHSMTTPGHAHEPDASRQR